jgi:homoserine kinase
MPQPRRIRVCVPASTSNLGPGFDALGLALDLQTTVEVEQADQWSIAIEGRGADQLPRGSDNLVYRRMEEFACWRSQTLPPVALRIANGIPLERGLGASGAASLCGLLAADALLQTDLDRPQLLDLACRLEGHPDNVTPSLLGGCTVSVVVDGHVTALHVPFPDDLVCALCIPDLHMPTHAARELMPPSYSRADAVFNLSRAALLVTALATRQFDALPIAVQDRMHQPYRAHMFAALPEVIDAAHAAGALGAFLSGAGSTVAAFARADQAAAIAQAMAAACEQHGLVCETRVAAINRAGATVEMV